MKKLVFTLGLCMVTVVCFGQKKNVAEALKLAKDAKPNFPEARTKIKAALQNDETKNDAKTWFTAGQIEDIQFSKENTKLMLGQQPNESVMYEALFNIYPYFEKAYELDLLPDAKGNVKPKYVKDMKSILRLNLPYYINGGGYFAEQQKNSKKAFEYFDLFVTIHDSPLMTSGEPATTTPDSNYIFANYYAARFAVSASLDNNTIIQMLKRAIPVNFDQNYLYQLLAETYKIADDMENFEKTLDEGLSLYPTETYFLRNLIRLFLDTERNDKALEYTVAAIKVDPSNAQLYHIAGFIYEKNFNDFVKAEEHLKKAIELDSESAEYQTTLGLFYFNQGVTQLDIANEIADVKKYNEEREKVKDFFRKALPYFEKAFSLEPEAKENKIALRSIYYTLDMGDKLDEIEKLIEE